MLTVCVILSRNFLNGSYQHTLITLNERQIKLVKRLPEEGEGGFEGGLTAGKYQGMAKASRATLTRDLADLVGKGILILTGERKAARYYLNWGLARKK